MDTLATKPEEPNLEHELRPLGPAYRYQSLGTNEVRLLHLDSIGHPLRGRFVRQSLEDCFDYKAISYTWGVQRPRRLWLAIQSDDEATEIGDSLRPWSLIHCEDQVIEIGDNLSALLQTLGSHDRRLPFWIDALCIDQGNHQEKLHQIPLMRDVYSRACEVLVWLGSATDDIVEAARALPEVNADLEKLKVFPTKSHKAFNRPLPGTLIRRMHGLCDILTRSWWTRLWTMQEYVLAREATFLCGEGVIESKVLRRFVKLYDLLNLGAIESLYNPELLYGPSPNAITILPILEKMRHRTAPNAIGARNLSSFESDISVLVSAFARKATVAADKIRGLLGLLRSVLADYVVLEGNPDACQTYMTIVSGMFTQQEQKENLALLHYTDTHTKMAGLPSWCPNFNSGLRSEPLGQDSENQLYLYNAASISVSPEKVNCIVGKVPTSMCFRGLMLDTIHTVVDGSTSGWQDAVWKGPYMRPGAQFEWELSCLRLARSLDKVASTIAEMYTTTLVAGSKICGTSVEQWNPSLSAYKAFKKRLKALADPHWDWGHQGGNPGQYYELDKLNAGGTDPLQEGGEGEEFHQRMFQVCRARTFFTTRGGRLGIGQIDTKAGDLIALLYGGRTPFVVRGESRDEGGRGNGTFRLIGEAYVHGVMHGQGFVGEMKDRWFEIV
jgi:hypothetical protein